MTQVHTINFSDFPVVCEKLKIGGWRIVIIETDRKRGQYKLTVYRDDQGELHLDQAPAGEKQKEPTK